LLAAGRTGKPVNVKKGQFLAPGDMRHVVEKIRSTGNAQVLLTERGTSFGYHVRAAVAAGCDGLFLEVHPDPDRAPSDGPNMLPLDSLPSLLTEVTAIQRVLRHPV